MVGFAHTFSIEDFHICCRHARHLADPEGFDTDSKEDFERRWLQVSPMLDGMHSVDGVLDPVTGAAFRTALDALAGWRGPGDTRNQSQRMADALAELLDHHMNEGLLPRRKGVRPHVSLTTTLPDRKSTRLNSSHSQISYAVFCLKKKLSRPIAILPIFWIDGCTSLPPCPGQCHLVPPSHRMNLECWHARAPSRSGNAARDFSSDK